MARFHFNVNDGLGLMDDEGSELPDWATARVAAIILVGEMLRDNPKGALSCDNWHLEVTDGYGLVFLRVDIGVTEAPAMRLVDRPNITVVTRS